MYQAHVTQTLMAMVLARAKEFMTKCRLPLALEEQPRHAVMLTEDEICLLDRALAHAEFLRGRREAEKIRREDAAMLNSLLQEAEASRKARREEAR